MKLWYLFLLASIAAVGWVIWAYRKRASKKAAASSARMRELLAEAPRLKTPMAATAAVMPSVQPAAAQAVDYARKERLLDHSQTLLFQRLKTGLPDLEVFANVSLSAVVDISATARGAELESLRRQLAVHCVDFVVCERNTAIVAAVEFETAVETAKFKTQCLEAAGIRHVRINPKAIPEQQEMHALIFGVKR